MHAIPELQPISSRPLEEPTYNSRNLSSYHKWESDNTTSLRARYERLCKLGGGCSYEDFVAIQFDIEIDRLNARLVESQDEPRLRSWDEIDADNAGVPTRGEI